MNTVHAKLYKTSWTITKADKRLLVHGKTKIVLIYGPDNHKYGECTYLKEEWFAQRSKKAYYVARGSVFAYDRDIDWMIRKSKGDDDSGFENALYT